ncbi:hypothetical protein AA0472_0923 [Acetobacter estunensis NRIC 0472]|uniref:Uncharacterized protein n=1 Tax=Acetobacter estunensis TaxID=104097 RepID=A0A967B2T8_9PROT|nr:hypothetical protein [Acetobacter estunensis]NHO52685.1 hypothetical protein [Acetobacter estunensis]GBQ22907.1 hypothetical protein AA0472_0923 [Acetobacter estunensis NRIC 0472]
MAVARDGIETATQTPRRQWKNRLRAVALCLALAACQASPAVSLRPTPHSLIYSYMMAHGMARGAVMSGGMTPRQIMELIVVDHAALLAVAREMAEPSGGNMHAANDAIIRLVALTQPVDGKPQAPAQPRMPLTP